jgi:hypothetical protein
MDRRLLVLAAPLLWSCASLRPVAVVVAPGNLVVGSVEVSAVASDCSLRLTIRNGSDSPLAVALLPIPPTIGSTTTVEERVVGYREETVCDGERCWVVKVPVVERTERSVAHLAELAVLPRRATIAPHDEIVAEVRLLDPAHVERAFTLVVQLRLRGGGEPYRLDVVCASAELLSGE